MAALLVCSLTAKDWLNGLLDSGVLEYNTGFFKTYGFEIGVSDGSGGLTMTAVAMFSVAGILLLSLMAMVFRNAYLIIKNSRGGTPFQEDNARMVKEIGIFYISMPIIRADPVLDLPPHHRCGIRRDQHGYGRLHYRAFDPSA